MIMLKAGDVLEQVVAMCGSNNVIIVVNNGLLGAFCACGAWESVKYWEGKIEKGHCKLIKSLSGLDLKRPIQARNGWPATIITIADDGLEVNVCFPDGVRTLHYPKSGSHYSDVLPSTLDLVNP